MKESLTKSLPKNIDATLRFLKLKYGLADLSAPHDVVDQETYFVSDTSIAPLSYTKELIRSFIYAKEEKQLKSHLVVVVHDKESQEELTQDLFGLNNVHILADLSMEERAAFFVRALGFVSLMYEHASEPLYAELMKFSVPLVLPKVDPHQALVGHAAYFLERLHEDDVSVALSKIENSEMLRTSLKKAASDRIIELSSGS